MLEKCGSWVSVILKDEDNDVEIEFKSTQLFTSQIDLTESVSRD